MRTLGVDVGRRRIGLALSDASGTLASPWRTIDAAARPAESAAAIGALVASLSAQGEHVAAVVVGLPKRLSGEDTGGTAPARALADALATATGLPVHLQDERLTSVEAESRLAERERDWRRRKKKLDAAAAAIILQDFLDQRARAATPGERA